MLKEDRSLNRIKVDHKLHIVRELFDIKNETKLYPLAVKM